MGWNTIRIQKEHALSKNLNEYSRFYHVHKYHLNIDRSEDVLFTTNYGYDFCTGFCHDNISGVQFHPEKSHKFGKTFLENFVKL